MMRLASVAAFTLAFFTIPFVAAASASAPVRVNTETTPASDIRFTDAALTTDAKTVVVGTAGPFKRGTLKPCSADSDPEDPACNFSRPFVARFLPDGSPDPTFGNGKGYALLEPPLVEGNAASAQPGAPEAVASAAGGAVVILVGNSLNNQRSLWRLHADGTRDESYGDEGAAAISPDLILSSAANALAVDASDRAVVGGSVADGFGAERFTPSGEPDSTFDGDGVATRATPKHPIATAMTVRPDGRLLLVGDGAQDSVAQVFASQFRPDGTPDPGFGSGGQTTITVPQLPGASPWQLYRDAPKAVAVDPTTGDATVGLEQIPLIPEVHFRCGSATALRITAAGALDSSFGDGGFAPDASFQCVRDLDLLGSGQLFLVGDYLDYSAPFFLTETEYTSSGALDPGFRDGPATLSVVGVSTRASSALQLPNGNVITVGSATVPRCIPVRSAPKSTQCGLGYILAQRPDGSVAADFGRAGLLTMPETRRCGGVLALCPYPYHRQFKQLARDGAGRAVLVSGRQLAMNLRCNAGISEACDFRVRVIARGSGRRVARLRPTELEAQHTRTASATLTAAGLKAIHRDPRLEIRATVDAAHQTPVTVSRRVRLAR